MGDDKSRKQTENAALTEARRNAVEYSTTYIQSQSRIENFELKEDLIQAFSKAAVQVLAILEKKWDPPAVGDCYTIRIRAEVVPNEGEINQIAEKNNTLDDPTAPLTVRVWTSQPTYKEGETMKVYVKGNKPFFARLVYVDAEKTTLQLLPNPFRTQNHFDGGVVYEVPQATDKFDLTVGTPYGQETLTIFASTNQLGNISTTKAGGVFLVKDNQSQVAAKTRGISLTMVDAANRKTQVAEFAEASVKVITKP